MRAEIVNNYRLNVSRGSDGFYKVTKQRGKEKFTVARCETKAEAIRIKESLARLLAQITSPPLNTDLCFNRGGAKDAQPFKFLVLRNGHLYQVLLNPLEVTPLERSARRFKKRDEKKYQLPFKEFTKLPGEAQALLLEIAAPIELALEFRKEIKRRKNREASLDSAQLP